jgi:hypothetical protein
MTGWRNRFTHATIGSEKQLGDTRGRYDLRSLGIDRFAPASRSIALGAHSKLSLKLGEKNS